MTTLPSTHTLQCLEASARLGSFTAAAKELHLTQGAISRQLQSLEQLLGVPMFDRGGQGLKLTVAGDAYLADIKALLLGLERATSRVRLQAGRGGVLNLSIPASWGNFWLIPRLPSFHEKHPQISINLMTRVGPADFSLGGLDAAVEYRPSTPANHAEAGDFLMPLILQPYATSAWLKTHAWDQAFLQRYGSFLLQHTTVPHAWRGWLTYAYGEPFATTIPVQGPKFELMSMCMSAAAQDFGTALLPKFMAQSLVRARKLKCLSVASWQAPGGYFLRASPLLRSEGGFNVLRNWLLDQAIALKRDNGRY